MKEGNPTVGSHEKESSVANVLRMVDEGLAHALATLEKGGTVTPETLKLLLAQAQYAREQSEKRDQRLQEAEQQANKTYEMAHKDELTHLLNRRGFTGALDTRIERARETPNDKLYAFYIDIDGFKEINDKFGHKKGDKYLELISKHMMTALRPDDTLGRIGGDEFTALCFIRHQPDETEELNYNDKEAEKIQKRIQQAVYDAKLELLGEGAPELEQTASIGFVQFDGVQSADDLMNQADEMMYDIKNTKRVPAS
jgi:diguanylate cyclase (GGDEF)-like protein